MSALWYLNPNLSLADIAKLEQQKAKAQQDGLARFETFAQEVQSKSDKVFSDWLADRKSWGREPSWLEQMEYRSQLSEITLRSINAVHGALCLLL